MKRATIVALVCLNAALLVALIFGATTQPASAQVIGGGNAYLVMTGRVASSLDAVYIVDLANRRLGVWAFDKTSKRVHLIAKRDLPRDFK